MNPSKEIDAGLLKIYNTCLEMLADRGYAKTDSDISELDFYINGVHNTRVIENQPEPIRFMYIQKYSAAMRQKFESAQNCRIVLVIGEKTPSSAELSLFKTYKENGTYVEVFEAERLKYNVTKHVLVPKHTLLTEEEKQQVLKDIKATEIQLQTIEITDPVAKHYGMREGDVVMITRVSETAGKYVNFRICAEK
ncbi:RNA_polymerase II subunit Rpb5a [Hexamita inflata]|uniref:RNA_polymerase II subunit Rpb5a n=1 Tax=Hexamita inflata TaxID=28002 RepID=A0ABP1H7F8_9EUKA